jgi:CRP-like cAMP-binding protein
MTIRHDPVIHERRFFAKGQLILKEGSPGSEAFLIQSGEVAIYMTKDGVDVELNRLGAGQIIGEMAVIVDAPRSASVKAASDTILVVISRPQFEDKLKSADPMVRAVVQMLSKRISNSNLALLDKKSDLQDLKDTARILYQNFHETLPPNQQWMLKSTVYPSLEALFRAIDNFRDRYESSDDIK